MAGSSENNVPLVSVLMPVYNCGRHLAMAVESVLEQKYSDFELVIVDDGSADGSGDIIRSFNDPRIVMVENGVNRGIVETLNRGIALCRGKYIARMDGDDVCHPRRLERQVAFMESHPMTGLCGTWVKTIDGGGNITGKAKNLTGNAALRINLLFSVPFYHPSVMIRAELLKSNLYDPEFPQAQDFELWTRLADLTRVANLPHYLMYYRWHNENISVRNFEAQQKKKREVLRSQLGKLGISPTPGELDLHQATFGPASVSPNGLHITPENLEAWYKKLIAANGKAKRYGKTMFRAYLWSRWAVYCRTTGITIRAFFPAFASPDPRVIFYLARFVIHFSGKTKSGRG